MRVQSGPSSSNNDATASPGSPADLMMTKLADRTEINSGGTIVYTLRITNNGYGTSSGYYVVDELPSGVTNAYTNTPGCSVRTTDLGKFEVLCHGADGLGPNQFRDVTVTATMPTIAIGQPAICLTNSATVIGNEADPNGGNNNDSTQVCVQPPAPSGSLVIIKNLPEGRAFTMDQFRLQGFKWDTGAQNHRGAALGSEISTQGTKVGIQDERFVSSISVAPGEEVLIQESLYVGVPQRYETSLHCNRVNSSGAVIEVLPVSLVEQAGSVRYGKLTFPSTPGADVVCVFTNTYVQGSVIWEKVDDSGSHLEGSAWRLVSTTGAVLEIEDCTSGTAASCSGSGRDIDPRPGFFEVKNLDWAQWTLTETRAPAGYTLSGEERTFTVGSAGVVSFDLGQIVNSQIEVPGIPLTGGIGEQVYLGSAGLLGAAVAILLLLRRRRQLQTGVIQR